MSACSVCGHEVSEDVTACLACGAVVSVPSSSDSGRHLLRRGLLVAMVIALPLLGAAFLRVASLNLTYFGTKVMEKGPDFRGQTVPMQRIDVTVRGGYLEIPLHHIVKAKLVQFYYRERGFNIPLIAYVGPTGRLITAFAMCEPSENTDYHFEGNTLVNNKCSATYALEGDGATPRPRPAHMGLGGDHVCNLYGPEFVENQVVDEMVRIPVSKIEAWTPRM